MACAFASDDPTERARHIRSHGFTKVEYPQVPEIIGPRLLDARHLDDEDFNDRAELYYRAAALLYCPFRHPKDFLDQGNSAKEHFERWNPNGQPKLRRAQEFYQQYYLSLDEASGYCAQQTTNDPDSTCTDEDVQDRQHQARGDIRERLDELLVVSTDLYSHCDDVTEVTTDETEDLQKIADQEAMRKLLSSNVVHAELPDDNVGRVTVRSVAISKTELKAFKKQNGA